MGLNLLSDTALFWTGAFLADFPLLDAIVNFIRRESLLTLTIKCEFHAINLQQRACFLFCLAWMVYLELLQGHKFLKRCLKTTGRQT